MIESDLPNETSEVAQTKRLSWPLRLLKSVFRVLGTVLAIIATVYWWNPQKIHYPKILPPVPNPIKDPDTTSLFRSGTRVTVVAGHPDDAEFYISGTLLKLFQAGVRITVIVVTDGDKGYYPPFTTNVEENRSVRRLEQKTASAAYGASVIFLGGPDGRYNPDDPKEQAKLFSALREADPEYIMCFETKYLPLVQHRDHENSGKATQAVMRKTNARWVLYFATTANNYFVDTSNFWDKRSELLAVHKSQFYGEKLEAIRDMVLSRSEDHGSQNGTHLAEGFRVERLNP